MNLSRRSFFAATAGLIAAPAIVRVASIMPVSVPRLIVQPYGRSPAMDALGDMQAYNRLLRASLGDNPAFFKMMHNIATALSPLPRVLVGYPAQPTVE